MGSIPRHVAIIMDGNRRWARKRGLPGIIGHRAGAKSIEKVMEAAHDAGVKILTLYTFSTENWKRPKKEVEALMKMLEDYLDAEYKKMADNNIRLTTIGDMGRFTPALRKKIQRVKELTRGNSELTLNLALNYGSRGEIVEAARRLAEDAKRGKVDTARIDEKVFSRYLYTDALPDPDLLIRTGGELRVSNFLLWQISYTELYVTKKFWPDFGKNDFEKAVRSYSGRDRRIGA